MAKNHAIIRYSGDVNTGDSVWTDGGWKVVEMIVRDTTPGVDSSTIVLFKDKTYVFSKYLIDKGIPLGVNDGKNPYVLRCVRTRVLFKIAYDLAIIEGRSWHLSRADLHVVEHGNDPDFEDTSVGEIMARGKDRAALRWPDHMKEAVEILKTAELAM